MHAIIRGECGCAAASLWCRHAPSCGLAIGPRHKVAMWHTLFRKTLIVVYVFFSHARDRASTHCVQLCVKKIVLLSSLNRNFAEG